MQTTNNGRPMLVAVPVPVPVTPGTPDSAHIIIGAAGFAAHERRQPREKTLMNCFRDRSTSSTGGGPPPAYYMRGHSTNSATLLRLESSAGGGGGSGNALDQAGIETGRPEAVRWVRELKSKPNKLALLKSSSTRDLTRLLLEDANGSTSTAVLVSNTSLDVCSSNSSSASSPLASGRAKARARDRDRDRDRDRECCSSCSKRWHELKQRMHTMEQDLLAQASYSQELEAKLLELTRQLGELMQDKDKDRDRDREKQRGVAGGGAGKSNVRPSRLVAWMNLSNWWKSRPSVETLREQRIFFDEPCFDTELELVLKHDQQRTVPRIVVDCCDLIEHKYRRSTQPIEGIYRQCGDYNKIQTLRFSIDANDYEALRQPDVDIHTLTGVLKLFLREIKSPLVSVNEAKTFIGTPHQWLLTELALKLDTLKRLIRSLPESNRDTMDYIFGHFNRLTKVPLQQISAETLSISVTPSIFHTVPQGVHMQDIQQLLREGETLADCVKLMIEYHSRIFECTADRRLHRLSVRNLKKTLSQPDLLFHNIF
ncbi:rho GTPase-activating protein 15 isoform X1 [Drosophila subobscura]|uniref:rho GTPase-activating protein 15 isoform X1 n=2 Tax=Drosophila subobscura TaxID=7241 RepID=UPI00155A9F1D|nr:rho GTPase-activating protein 15 isoform X1 [Drosophila subobscura]